MVKMVSLVALVLLLGGCYSFPIIINFGEFDMHMHGEVGLFERNEYKGQATPSADTLEDKLDSAIKKAKGLR